LPRVRVRVRVRVTARVRVKVERGHLAALEARSEGRAALHAQIVLGEIERGERRAVAQRRADQSRALRAELVAPGG